MKKINNKGFTLIEMLAAIVILGVISVVTIVSVVGSLDKSKDKAEEAFKMQVEDYVSEYIAMYSKNCENSDDFFSYQKCYQYGTGSEAKEECDSVTLYKTKGCNNLEVLLDTVVGENVVNPKTDKKCTKDNTELTIYRDTDYVYCFIIKPSGPVEESCISGVVSTCEGMYKPIENNCDTDEDGYCTFN